MQCDVCGVSLDERHPKRGWRCFACHVKSLKFGFVGGGSYGKQAFHDRTIRERQEEELRGAAQAGHKIVPVPQRAELI